MATKYFKNGQLKDEIIVDDLHKAAEIYSNGEIIEVRDILENIINSIDEFSNTYNDCILMGGAK